MFVVGAATAWLYRGYVRQVEVRLHGERTRTLPRVYGRPLALRRGQALSVQELVNRLNDLGYTRRTAATRSGQFSVEPRAVVIAPRGRLEGRRVRVSFDPVAAQRRARTPGAEDPGRIRDLVAGESGSVATIELDAPILTALMPNGAREKRRHVALATIPLHVRQAVLAIEDQRFYSHPGINPVRLAAAVITNATGVGRTVVGSSTITQQLARMFFFADDFNAELQTGTRGRSLESYWRKARETLMSIALERRASKDEILELYLNDVYLGHRGSFAVHGVAEAARLFFGRDVSNLSYADAALIAGVIHSPATRSPFTNAARAVERRNVVLRAMAHEGAISDEQAARSSREPLQVAARSVDREAPYFVDLVGRQLADDFPGVTAQAGAVDVYTSLDLNLQRAAIDAVRHGLAAVDQALSRRRRRPGPPPQAALVAVDPRTGEILAMVGGRSYNQSQYNRAVAARRQPGSVFKPFVFLAAFERAADDSRTDFTPASITLDEPGSFLVNDRAWEPRNFDAYDGPITWRRALAMSRNLGTIRVGEQVGFDQVAAVWRRVGVGTPPQPYPSIALGVFELTPVEVAQAYTLFVNDGAVRPLRSLLRIEAGGRTLVPNEPRARTAVRPTSAYLVTSMLRSVLDEGTGARARAAGFELEAAGKSGTTNDLRDAWFVGFTPELLTVVWVGYDDNRPLGLTGSAAALPIWTEFMKTALAGRPTIPFAIPEGITFVDIDPDTGLLATPGCPRTFTEAFAAGTAPVEYCALHQGE